MSKYEILVKILDELRNEAPINYKKYHPSEDQKDELDKARARAFIHLFLKGRFGLYDFNERENYITDGSYDGGIDAYFIDKDQKVVFFIQSKFRTNEKNFESKEIEYDELLAMDVTRITEGEDSDEEGNPYNSKIKNMQSIINSIDDIGRYSYKVIILANLVNCKDSILRKLVGGYPVSLFNFEKCFKELVFHIVAGCFYKAEEIQINLSLANKEGNEGRISYTVNTELSDCKILVTFVPLIEIGKILFQYRNSILKFNPRCFLGLNNNTVNPKIADTVTNKKTNEFALFNNGITILSDETQINSQIAKKDRAQLLIRNPQIINGGQTSFTLASIYERCMASNNFAVFGEKEVLVKVITFVDSEDNDQNDKEVKRLKKLKLIENLSRATNEQSSVGEADRRSNETVMVNYQEKIFDEFGYFFNRKQGEFSEGLQKKYITKDLVIDPSVFIRVALSVNGDATKARRNSDNVLFREDIFFSVFLDTDIYRKYMFGYFCYLALLNEEKKYDKVPGNKYGVTKHGNALRYGKYAVVSVASRAYREDLDTKEYYTSATEAVLNTLAKWKDFEIKISKITSNIDYLFYNIDNGEKKYYFNYDGYYKGKTLNTDLKNYDTILGKSV